MPATNDSFLAISYYAKRYPLGSYQLSAISYQPQFLFLFSPAQHICLYFIQNTYCFCFSNVDFISIETVTIDAYKSINFVTHNIYKVIIAAIAVTKDKKSKLNMLFITS